APDCVRGFEACCGQLRPPILWCSQRRSIPCPPRVLPPARILTENEIPKRVRLGFQCEEEPAWDKQIPQIRQTHRVKLQSGATIHRQDDVECETVQSLVPVSRHPP